MNLQEMFYGTFTPPESFTTRRFYIDDQPPPYIFRMQQSIPAKKTNRKKNSQERTMVASVVIPYLLENPGSSIDDIADGTGLVRKSIATAMVRLVDNMMVEREKGCRKDGKMKVYKYWART